MARSLLLPLLAVVAVLAISWLLGELLRQRRKR